MDSIAEKYEFRNYRQIYDHPKNAPLKKKRPNPNILAAGDIVYIPDKGDKTSAKPTDQTHDYEVKRNFIVYRTVVNDANGKPIAGTGYKLELPSETRSGVTDGNGLLEEKISLDIDSGKLILVDLKMSWKVHFGHLDPIDTIAGVKARLKSLGFLDGDISGSMDEKTKRALQKFQKENGLTVSGDIDADTRAKLVQMHGC
jgi:N-acetylmuramoyl-L-alanine amidase